MENLSRLSVCGARTSSLPKTSKSDNSYARLMGAIVGIHIVAISALYNIGMFIVAN